jgi:hypothetical protein
MLLTTKMKMTKPQETKKQREMSSPQKKKKKKKKMMDFARISKREFLFRMRHQMQGQLIA